MREQIYLKIFPEKKTSKKINKAYKKTFTTFIATIKVGLKSKKSKEDLEFLVF